MRKHGRVLKCFANANNLGLALLLLFSAIALRPQTASAHAAFVRSDPAPNTVLDQGPRQVKVWFSEPLEPGFSDIRVLEATGGRVDQADSRIDANDPNAMSVTVAPLAQGIYTVAWRTNSKVDGHSITGSFVFSVRQPLTAENVPEPGKPQLFSSPFEPVLRWVSLLSAMVLAGGLALLLFIVGPALRRYPEAGQRLRVRMHRLLWLAVVLLLLSEVGRLIFQSSSLQGISALEAVGRPLWTTLRETDWGRLWLWRMALLAGFALALDFATSPGARTRIAEREMPATLLSMAPLGLSLGILLTFSLASHAAALEGLKAAGVFTDFTHLVSAAVWGGGVVCLAATLPVLLGASPTPERGALLASIVPRFSTAALLCVGALIITGTFGAWALVGTLPAFPGTAYGRDLIAKLLLFLPLVVLGALNLLWVPRRLTGSDTAALWLRRFVLGEAFLVTLVVLTVGVLTSLEPARQEAARNDAGQAGGQASTQRAGDLSVTFSISPGTVGANRLLVTLKDRRGRPVEHAQVSVQLRYLGRDVGATSVEATHRSDDKYEVADAFLSLTGPWQAEVSARRPGSFDAQTTAGFQVVSPGTAPPSTWMPSHTTGVLLWGVELLLLGLLGVGVAVWRLGRRMRPVVLYSSPALLAGVAGLFVIAQNTWMTSGSPEPLSNPFPPTGDSVSMGRQIYEANCLSCHGDKGKGDGPAAETLNPKPLDLTIHGPLHEDFELYRFISKGVAGTAMPAWEKSLTPEERWHLVNYLRTLAPQQ